MSALCQKRTHAPQQTSRQQPAIVDRDLFDAVQAKLNHQGINLIRARQIRVLLIGNAAFDMLT
jgi:hypothetical protein